MSFIINEITEAKKKRKVMQWKKFIPNSFLIIKFVLRVWQTLKSGRPIRWGDNFSRAFSMVKPPLTTWSARNISSRHFQTASRRINLMRIVLRSRYNRLLTSAGSTGSSPVMRWITLWSFEHSCTSNSFKSKHFSNSARVAKHSAQLLLLQCIPLNASAQTN